MSLADKAAGGAVGDAADTDGAGEAEGAKRKGGRKKKGPFMIDFMAPPDEDLEKAFVPAGRAATTLSQGTRRYITVSCPCTDTGMAVLRVAFALDFDCAGALEKAGEVGTTLPTDVHYDVKMLAKLFLKNQYIVPVRSSLLITLSLSLHLYLAFCLPLTCSSRRSESGPLLWERVSLRSGKRKAERVGTSTTTLTTPPTSGTKLLVRTIRVYLYLHFCTRRTCTE